LGNYSPSRLEDIISDSRCCKARLLHYFGRSEQEVEEMLKTQSTNQDLEFSDWCGWHNDHGSLTGLASAIYLNQEGEEVTNTDKTAGLYIRKRNVPFIFVIIFLNDLSCRLVGGSVQGFHPSQPSRLPDWGVCSDPHRRIVAGHTSFC